MKKEEMEESIVQSSMQIILYAGDAREANLEAIKALEIGDFQKAEACLNEAEENITIAHKAQTDRIQAETRGEKGEYSLLFAHAQDTLMTINSEIILTRRLLKVFHAYELRIQKLEKDLKNIHE
ncbi:PTS lactose/cellobiose transporter subunit IIA [[Eubacterium] hominis]|uniref:PTS lactose/cellobiose transporter subunit IIA n=1 Tax=[Eubacterium] hominis TaxID=2764325 RepID=UPI003A4D40F7